MINKKNLGGSGLATPTFWGNFISFEIQYMIHKIILENYADCEYHVYFSIGLFTKSLSNRIK